MNDMIPCAGSITFVFLILGFIVLMRYLNYIETLKLAEKGLVKQPVHQNGNGNGKSALIWGILLTAIGLAITIGIWPVGFMLGTTLPFGFGPWMLVGLLPTFFGLGLVLIHVLTREPKQKDEAENQPEKPKE